jgi:flavorubredoxin
MSEEYGSVIFEEGAHKVVWLGWDREDRSEAVQTNQYLIVHNGKGILLDPGGVHLFSRVVAAVSNYINIDDIETIFFSHQDPDVSSGIALWLGITSAKIHISELWLRFMPHFGIIDQKRLVGVPDNGARLQLAGGGSLEFIPAHFLHAPGNFVAFDESSGILFSSDIGAAVFDTGQRYLYVEDFDAHLKSMEGFHKRYMGSNAALRRFVKKFERRDGKRDVKMVAPQHGAIFREETVDRLFKWLSQLSCGIDILEEIE